MSKKKSAVNQYVLLPAKGLRAEGALHSAFTNELNANVRPRAMRAFGVARASGVTAGLRRPSVRVVSQINEDKAKLLEMTPEDALAMRTQLPGARLIPVRYYRTAVAPKPALLQAAKKAAAGPSLRITLTFVSKEDGSPIAGATVVAFTDFAERIGARGYDQRSRQSLAVLGRQQRETTAAVRLSGKR